MISDIEDDELGEVGGTLIRTFGELWSRDAVNWDKGEMSGERRKYKKTVHNLESKTKACNVWKLRGVYALYRDFKLVYVGQATSVSGLGGRLYEHHTKSRFHRQWDSFSWFSTDGLDTVGNRQKSQPLTVDTVVIARTLELITILIADPPLNRSRGRFKGAERVVQGKTVDIRDSDKALLQRIRTLLDISDD